MVDPDTLASILNNLRGYMEKLDDFDEYVGYILDFPAWRSEGGIGARSCDIIV